MVVDGSAAYIMTANFSRSAFRANREFVVRDVERGDVRQVEAVFQADWRARPLVPHDARVPISPSNSRVLLAALIASAGHTLEIYAEEFNDAAMAGLLTRRARTGVQVRLLLPAASAGGSSTEARDVTLLHSAGGEVRRMGPGGLYLHAKAIVADGREAFVGSENFSAASLDHNREVGLLIADQGAIATLRRTFATDWQAARPAAR